MTDRLSPDNTTGSVRALSPDRNPTPGLLGNAAMNSTGQSFFRPSIEKKEAPARISATKKHCISPALPGGLQLNALHLEPTEVALKRENNRVAGFGPGMAGALIGNSNRRGNSLTVNDVKDNRTALGSIGWGSQNAKLEQGIYRRILPEMPHKKAFDAGGLRNLPHMELTGKFAAHLDNQLGIPYEMLDEMSVRE